MVDEPEKTYPTASVMWKRFVSICGSTLSLLQYAPLYRAYIYQALQQLYDDAVQYTEMRTHLQPVCSALYGLFLLAVWGLHGPNLRAFVKLF